MEDREAIRELHNQYCFIQDRGHSSHSDADVAAFLALCDPAIVWDNSPDGSRAHRGHAAVAAYLRALGQRFESCMHYVHNQAIVFESDDRASRQSSFEAGGEIGGGAFRRPRTSQGVYGRT